MMGNTGSRLKKFAVILVLFSGALYGAAQVKAEDVQQTAAVYSETAFSGFGITYSEYYAQHKDKPLSNKEIEILCGVNYKDQGANVRLVDESEDRKNLLEWTSEEGTVTWEFTVSESGLYVIDLVYKAIEGRGKSIEMALLVDGKSPFNEAGELVFPRLFRDEYDEDGRFLKDRLGNELIPTQSELFVWQRHSLCDADNNYIGPFVFWFEAGNHSISLQAISEPVLLHAIYLTVPQKVLPYAEVVANYPGNTSPEGYIQKVQAENALYKSDTVVHPLSDKSSPDTQPYDKYHTRMNTFGGSAWSKPGQWAVWEIYVPEDGVYKIGFKFRQSFVRGLTVSRKLYIDGAVPFGEARQISFTYSSRWQNLEVGEKEPYLFYLKKGTHQIKLEPTLGEAFEILASLDESVFKLNDIYRRIIMITGTTPDDYTALDVYRDYQLEKQIPGLVDVLKKQAESIRTQAQRMEALSSKKGSEAAILFRFAEQLESFAKSPNTIVSRLQRFKENLSAVAAWILNIKEQPLELDYLYVASPDTPAPPATTGFFSSLLHEIHRFIASFIIDYNYISGSDEGTQPIEVWVNSGRDQASVLSRLVNNSFTPKTQIPIAVRLVPGGLIQAIMAGKGPDIAVSVDRTTPLNLALRGAAVALESFDGFYEVVGRFQENAMEPYEYNGHYYALPETQIFDMMFYRKDIFEQLNIEPPQTWEDLYNIAPIIQKHNMQIGLPYGSASGSVFNALLFQRGGRYYNDEKTVCVLEKEGLEAFNQWVDFYLQYGFPLYKDDFNRFRTGEMPLTIISYSFYNQLMVAAPEIKGLWEMTEIPGTRDANGNIDRSQAATGTSCIMLPSAKTEEAWEFLKWWTSADIQEQFGKEIEIVLGPTARYATANIDAFNKMPWSKKEAELILRQWEHVREIPEVPGSYYTSRNLDNAFRACVVRQENPREMLTYWTNATNMEIKRKLKEFGLSQN